MKEEDKFEDVKCNLCNFDNSHFFFEGKDIVYKNKGLFSVVKCNNCGLVYTNPRPNQNIISNFYPNEYWDICDTQNIETKLKKIVHRVINKIYYKMTINFQPGGKILDIGCGDGRLLSKLKEEGWETYGIEISDLAADYAKKKLGLNVFQGTIEEAEFDDEFFDLIILSHVLEHLPDPKKTLIEVNRILKSEGILAISLPNVNSFEARLFKKYWIGWELPRHFYHFTPKTIKSLLDLTGFEVFKIKYDNNPNNILSSLKYFFEDKGLNPIIGLIIAFPFANIASMMLSKAQISCNIFIYSKKRLI